MAGEYAMERLRHLEASDERLRARVAQLEGACKAAAEQFDFYAEQHRQKQTPDGDHKEKVNREFAAKMRQALGGSDGR
jgi:hypothetical protein